MNHKRLLIIALAVMMLTGTALASVPFIASLAPSAKARADARIWIEVSSIPIDGALEVDGHLRNLLLVRNPDPKAFLMPYWDAAYRLPDLTWEPAWVPCRTFEIENGEFRCTDPDLPEAWREQAQWDLDGKNSGSSRWMPDLQVAPYRVRGNFVIVSPEYRRSHAQDRRLAAASLRYPPLGRATKWRLAAYSVRRRL
jgi:hypothetical protein